jgi:hypothetical protein
LFTGNGNQVGVCKTTPHGELGDACLETCAVESDCSYEVYGATDTVLTVCFQTDGLYCDESGTSPTCKHLVALGASCVTDDDCGSGNWCDTATCRRGNTVGQACGASCSPELECNTNGLCENPSFANGVSCTGYAPAP